MQKLTKGFTLNTRCGNMSADAVYRQQQQGKNNALPEFRNVKYVFYSGEHGLDHLGLAAGSLDFL